MASSTDPTKAKLDFTMFRNVVGGELRQSSNRKTRFTLNPATLEENPATPISTPNDVDIAIRAAREAAPSWAALSWADRQNSLVNFAEAVETNRDAFVNMLVREQGKTVFEAQGEVTHSLQWLRAFGAISLPEEEIVETSNARKIVKRYTPLGIAVGIVPWNYPIFLACQRLAQAVVTGNAFILKPSPFAPYCVLKLAELGLQFFPTGVLQALSGEDNLGPWLTAHAGVDVVSFAGSVSVGKKVVDSCSKNLKRVILELGGNDPVIVCDDIDIGPVATAVASIAFMNAGQICTIPKRVYVHDSIYEKFLSAMASYVNSLQLTTDEQIAIGPISNKPQYERVTALLGDIEKNKMKIAAGSTNLKPLADHNGFFVSPILVDNPAEDSRIVMEEPFGPILPVMRWSDEPDVIRRANDTEYGLGASVWSKNDVQAQRIARQLQAGNVWVNTHAQSEPEFPFGGLKHSGVGVEGGMEGLKGYCNLQIIWTNLALPAEQKA